MFKIVLTLFLQKTKGIKFQKIFCSNLVRHDIRKLLKKKCNTGGYWFRKFQKHEKKFLIFTIFFAYILVVKYLSFPFLTWLAQGLNFRKKMRF